MDNSNITIENKDIKNVKNLEVFLRIYDLVDDSKKEVFSKLAGFKIDGVWHTAIEIEGKEYFYGPGIVIQEAGTVTNYGILKERISIGHTTCTIEDIHCFIENSKITWTANNYHLIDFNCNHFSDFLSEFLIQKGIPLHIKELSMKVKNSPLYEIFKNKSKLP